MIDNDGDFLIDIKNVLWQANIKNVNIIENKDLNFFFQYKSPDTSDQDHFTYENFAFFGNRPRGGTSIVKMSNPCCGQPFVLSNWVFDWSRKELPQILNGYSEENGRPVTAMETFQQADMLTMPTRCQIPSDQFTQSDTFSESLPFTSSMRFTDSSQFTKSSFFSPSSQFT